MASYTPNLNLLKKDPVADGNDFFNIKTMMNDNWDKIDAKVKAALDDIGDLQSEQVRIATGSYVGTGTYGSSNPCSLTFDFAPRYVIIDTGSGVNVSGGTKNWIFGITSAYSIIYPCVLTWLNNGISWYSTNHQDDQLNTSRQRYFWFAVGVPSE